MRTSETAARARAHSEAQKSQQEENWVKDRRKRSEMGRSLLRSLLRDGKRRLNGGEGRRDEKENYSFFVRPFGDEAKYGSLRSLANEDSFSLHLCAQSKGKRGTTTAFFAPFISLRAPQSSFPERSREFGSKKRGRCRKERREEKAARSSALAGQFPSLLMSSHRAFSRSANGCYCCAYHHCPLSVIRVHVRLFAHE